MDLTKEYPRSVRAKVAGVVMLGRATDKGKAFAAGTNGEYNYDCPMDKAVFGFLGIDGNEFLAKIKSAKSDAEIEEYARQFSSKKSQAELDTWNEAFLKNTPEPGSDGEAYFLEMRNSIDPSRTDVTAWADLLDLDEKRDVPRRVPA
jgi:Domain of unknown function (DUF5069)